MIHRLEMLVVSSDGIAGTGLGDWLVLTLKNIVPFWLDPEDTDARTWQLQVAD